LILSLYHGHYDEWASYCLDQRRSTETYPLIGPLIDTGLGVSAEREKRLRNDPRTDVIGVGDFDAYIASAPVWPTPDVGDAFRSAYRNTIPVMFVNGDWDTSTPIENMLAIRKYYPNSRSILVHRGTHGARRELFDQNAEVREKVRGFLKTGTFPELEENVSVAVPEFRLPSFPAPSAASE
jgi:pimeloyl-ACP methyl ester carboxylesterase